MLKGRPQRLTWILDFTGASSKILRANDDEGSLPQRGKEAVEPTQVTRANVCDEGTLGTQEKLVSSDGVRGDD